MSTFLARVFTPLTAAHIEVLAELSQILLKSYFCTLGEFGKEDEILLAITPNYLFVSQVLSNLSRLLMAPKLIFFAPLISILNFRYFGDNGWMTKLLACLSESASRKAKPTIQSNFTITIL